MRVILLIVFKLEKWFAEWLLKVCYSSVKVVHVLKRFIFDVVVIVGQEFLEVLGYFTRVGGLLTYLKFAWEHLLEARGSDKTL